MRKTYLCCCTRTQFKIREFLKPYKLIGTTWGIKAATRTVQAKFKFTNSCAVQTPLWGRGVSWI